MKPNFLIIGAQKSGTTTLYAAMRSHPQIFMPPIKELEFFNRDDDFSKGFKSYLNTAPSSLESLVVGEASPQYLSSLVASQRIVEHCSDTKIIAILRDPVERAFSHYRMSVRRRRESRQFSELVEAQLELIEAGAPETSMDHGYVFNGLYGSLLERYRFFAETGRLKVLFFEELKRDPSQVHRELFDFLGVDFRRMRTDIHANQGGAERLGFAKRSIENSPIIRSVARALFSEERRRAIRFWLDTEMFVKKNNAKFELDKELDTQLREIYIKDGEKLRNLTGESAPWLRSWSIQK